MEPQAGESSNCSDKPASFSHPNIGSNIDKSSYGNSEQELNITSESIEESCNSACPMEVHNNDQDNLKCRPALVLRLALTRILSYECILILDILGEDLDWQQILQDVESNSLELKWNFYKSVVDDIEDHNSEDHNSEKNDEDSYQYSDEDSYMSEDDDIEDHNSEENDEDSYQYSDEYSYMSEDEESESAFDESEYEDSDHGPPPTAKSAIENLATRVICHDQVVSGDAICSICRDMIPLDEAAKELPCKHFYHRKCITEWLNIRNFCPLCKYEMPTDDPNNSGDPDYEE
jgi:hypothetical protein